MISVRTVQFFISPVEVLYRKQILTDRFSCRLQLIAGRTQNSKDNLCSAYFQETRLTKKYLYKAKHLFKEQ